MAQECFLEQNWPELVPVRTGQTPRCSAAPSLLGSPCPDSFLVGGPLSCMAPPFLTRACPSSPRTPSSRAALALCDSPPLLFKAAYFIHHRQQFIFPGESCAWVCYLPLAVTLCPSRLQLGKRARSPGGVDTYVGRDPWSPSCPASCRDCRGTGSRSHC